MQADPVAPPRRVPSAVQPSLLRQGALPRLVLAGLLAAAVWGVIAWAMA
ncbi:hypothetical protein OPKNFCMD_3699 [Methylobacterium crusticola]|uniref:ABC transporter permease n=1 Tax=Methylobacterium crusticola TaxID=1697972 RepID=A0ABQ4R1D4_9HYPH|nr:hypothetical protein [Methylobacterium crusticola]GJD50949.1 hypothetical protein OPKNFCMD_3699 [Methylobacterium crusticola]